MTKEELQALYKEWVIPESKAPYQMEQPESFDKQILAYNPLCGDKFELYLQGDSIRYDKIFFKGIGCAISKASTSLLARELEGKSRQEIIELCKQIINELNTDHPVSDQWPKALQTLIHTRAFDGRLDCVKLSWQALLQSLEDHDQ